LPSLHPADDLLRLSASVSAVATLVTYAGYVQSRGQTHDILGLLINVLWPTMLPATYALLRAIVQLERGRFDDPTELFLRDRAMQIAIVACCRPTTLCRIAAIGFPVARA